MTDPTPTTRSAAAGTLVMLLAMAATISSAPAVTSQSIEARPGLAESVTVRAMAAVMAAAARDLIGGETMSASLPTRPAEVLADASRSRDGIPATATGEGWRRLDERLLDLPPPRA